MPDLDDDFKPSAAASDTPRQTLEEKLAARVWAQASPAAAKLRECLWTLQKAIGSLR
jgi:hypothetical protein